MHAVIHQHFASVGSECCFHVQIKTLLLKLARESCLACLSSLQDRISMLQERPAELDTFMAYQVQCLTFALAMLILLDFVASKSEALTNLCL